MIPKAILLTAAFCLLAGCSPDTTTIDVEPSGCQSVEDCIDDDLCCPPGCQSFEDNDCLPACGNGRVEEGEVCDGDCPASCDDGIACTSDVLEGSASDCTAFCRHDPQTSCLSGDGCCPAGCNRVSDQDCSATCGNGFIEEGEVCDGDCPSDCNDHNPCTLDRLVGSAFNCSASCYNQRVVDCVPGDGCCPAGCTSLSDSDCQPRCGNGVLEPGETCDGDCPADCDDGDACTADFMTGAADSCDALCARSPISACLDGDGCCPPGCNSFEDDDCEACGEGEYPCGDSCCPWRIQVADQGCYRHSHLAVDASDRVILACQLPNAAFRLVIFSGNGRTSQDVGAGSYDGYRPVLAVDGAGRLRVAFIDRPDNRLFLASTFWSGWEFEAVQPMGQQIGLSRPMDIEADPNGGLQLSLYQDEPQWLMHARLSGNQWEAGVVDQGEGRIGWRQDLAVGPDGGPHLCYLNYDDRELWYAGWQGSHWRIEKLADGASDCAVDLGPAGNPWVAYSKNRRGIFLASDQGAGFETAVYSQDSEFRLYGLAVDSAGVAQLAFRETRPSDGHYQMYARYNGVRWSILTVDRIEDPFSGSGSLALDSQDRPYLSWFEALPDGQTPYRITRMASWH